MKTSWARAGALVTASLVAAYPTAAVPRFAVGVGLLGAVAVASLAWALLRTRVALVAWALAGLGVQYASFLLLRSGGVDGAAPLVAGGLAVAAELSYWSLAGSAAPEERATRRRRVAATVAVGGVAVAVGSATLAVSELAPGGGLGIEAAGVAAAAGAVGVVFWLAWRSRAPQDELLG